MPTGADQEVLQVFGLTPDVVRENVYQVHNDDIFGDFLRVMDKAEAASHGPVMLFNAGHIKELREHALIEPDEVYHPDRGSDEDRIGVVSVDALLRRAQENASQEHLARVVEEQLFTIQPGGYNSNLTKGRSRIIEDRSKDTADAIARFADAVTRFNDETVRMHARLVELTQRQFTAVELLVKGLEGLQDPFRLAQALQKMKDLTVEAFRSWPDPIQ